MTHKFEKGQTVVIRNAVLLGQIIDVKNKVIVIRPDSYGVVADPKSDYLWNNNRNRWERRK